jgi:hypothetical protein
VVELDQVKYVCRVELDGGDGRYRGEVKGWLA